jgi:inhibitor of KinA
VAAGAGPDRIGEWLEACVDQVIESRPGSKPPLPARTVEVPVHFGGRFAPDLEFVATHTKLAADEVVSRFCAGDYLVYMLGFSPGFPYLGGLPPELAVPRRASPRARVAPGSVAIGGTQAGIYPVESPGGWNIIGRTPLRLFLLEQNPPVRLRAGDHVKFRAMSREEFDQWPAP